MATAIVLPAAHHATESSTYSDASLCGDFKRRECIDRTGRQRTVKKKSKNLRVSFHPSAKSWDGVCTATHNLQNLVWDFWTKRSCAHVLDGLISDRKFGEICALHDGLEQAIQRIKHLDSRKCTPLSPRGGGKAIMLSLSHLPYIVRLHSATKYARDECYRLRQCDELSRNMIPAAACGYKY